MAVLVILVGGSAGFADASSGWSAAWRTPAGPDGICAVSGRWLKLPPSHQDVLRAWAGIRTHDPTDSACCVIRQRHDRQRDRQIRRWQADIQDGCGPQELSRRRQQTSCFTARYTDFVVIQQPGTAVPLLLVDENADGVLEVPGEVPESGLNPDAASENDWTTWLMIQPNGDGTIRSAGLPELPELPEPPEIEGPAPQTLPERLMHRLRRLDHPVHRKRHLPEIEATADRLLAFLSKSDSANRPLLAEVLYRKGRAIAYRDLPDVRAVHPVDDPAALQKRFEACYRRLAELVDMTQPAWILLAVRRERRRGCPGRALELLEQYRRTHPNPVWYLKKRTDLLNELGLSTAAHQTACARWLSGAPPRQPVPVILSVYTAGEVPSTSGNWRPDAPWRTRSPRFRRVAPDRLEAVVWLLPFRSYEWSVGTRRTGWTLDASFVRSGCRRTVRLHP